MYTWVKSPPRFILLSSPSPQSLKPAWEQAAKALKGIVAVGAADCDSHKEIAQEYRVQVPYGGRWGWR